MLHLTQLTCDVVLQGSQTVDPNYIKLFKLAQLTIEYLLVGLLPVVDFVDLLATWGLALTKWLHLLFNVFSII